MSRWNNRWHQFITRAWTEHCYINNFSNKFIIWIPSTFRINLISIISMCYIVRAVWWLISQICKCIPLHHNLITSICISRFCSIFIYYMVKGVYSIFTRYCKCNWPWGCSCLINSDCSIITSTLCNNLSYSCIWLKSSTTISYSLSRFFL